MRSRSKRREKGVKPVYFAIITIRPAEERDVPRIASLAGELGYPTSTETMAHRLAAIRGRADHALFVAEENGDCTGWVHVCLTDSIDTGRSAEIRGLVVTEGRRGSGTGTALVRCAEEWAAGLCDRIRVRSNVIRVRTHGFYERLGYKTTKSQKVFDKPLARR